MNKRYSIYWVGGDRDGELLGTTLTEGEAITMAKELEESHKDEFHPTWGGIAIVAPDGSYVEW